MRKLYLIVACAVSMQVAQAQSSNFTLEQCIDYALTNSISIQNSKLDERSAVARVREITGMGMPQVTGNVSLSYNHKMRRFFAENIDTAARPDAFGFVQNIPGAKDRDVVAGQNFFQLKGTGDASLSINQLIFNGSYFVGLQAAKALKELTVKQTSFSRVNVVDQVTKAFYLALINRERIGLFDSNIGRIDTLLRNTMAMNKSGFAETIDVDRLQVARNNLMTEREKFINLQALSLELLKFQMNYPMDSPLDITGDISAINPVVDPTAYKQDWDYQLRPDYQTLEVNRKLQNLNIKNYQSQALPAVYGFANLGYFTQSSTVGGLLKTNTGINDNGVVGPDKWYGYSMFGVTMSVPVFSGFQLKYRIQQERITLLKIENGMKQMKSGIDLEIKSALASYQNAVKGMEAQKQNMELSAKISRVTKIKYEQGVGSNLEVLDAQSTLKESQINYYNAMYDAVVAKVNLDKAYGKLLPETKSNQN
jgi:outer membrane protein